MADDPRRPLVDKRDEEAAERPQTNYALWRSDLWDVCLLSGPACLQLLFQYAVIVTNQSFAGHIGADELAAAAIAVTLFNFLWYFLLGLSSAQDTLGSQAFGGNDRPGVLSWSITTAFCMSVLAIPMGVVLYFGDFLAIKIFQQPPEVADLVAVYCQGMIPGLLPLVWSIVIMKAMQAQNIMWGPTWMTVGMFFANLALNVVGSRAYGFWGVAYAQSAGRIVQFLLLVVYVWLVDNECLQYHKPCWIALADAIDVPGDEAALTAPLQPGMDGAAASGSSSSISPRKPDEAAAETSFSEIIAHAFRLQRIGVFLKLGLPGGFMMAADASAFDITTAMAGFLGTVEVGAHTALLTLCVFIYMAVPFGIATAATIRVGNMLGAGNPAAAQRTSWLAMGLCAIYSTIMTVLIAACHGEVGYIFTSAPRVVAVVSKISFLAAIYQLPDAVYGTFSGVLRGMGRQAQLVWCNVLGFWVVGTLTGYLLAFQAKLGVAGLWLGINAGVLACAIFTSVLMYLVNWEKESEKAQALVMKADIASGPVDGNLDGFSVPEADTHSSAAQGEDEALLGTDEPRALPPARHSRPPPSSQTSSRGSSPERVGRPIARSRYSHGSLGSHPGLAPHPIGSVSSTLTGSYIASLTNRDFASGTFRRV